MILQKAVYMYRIHRMDPFQKITGRKDVLQVSNTASVKLRIEFLVSPNTVLWFYAKIVHRFNLLNPKNM